jgi:hypothetical protein
MTKNNRGFNTSVYLNDTTVTEIDYLCKKQNISSGSKLIIRLINDKYRELKLLDHEKTFINLTNENIGKN